MKTLYRPANSNNEYEHKKEFMKLAARVWPDKKRFRWDKARRVLDNYLWFLKFETQFTDNVARRAREEIWVRNVHEAEKVNK